MKPFVGLPVHYNHGGKTFFGIVCGVNADQTVNLAVFSNDGVSFPRTSVKAGTADGTWRMLTQPVEESEALLNPAGPLPEPPADPA